MNQSKGLSHVVPILQFPRGLAAYHEDVQYPLLRGETPQSKAELCADAATGESDLHLAAFLNRIAE
jgi:hypothetical protein